MMTWNSSIAFRARSISSGVGVRLLNASLSLWSKRHVTIPFILRCRYPL